MEGERKKIAVRVCGGCFCKYDVKAVLQKIIDAFSNDCSFTYSYRLEDDEQFDSVLLINGCDYQCAEKSTLRNNIIINNTNWEQANVVFAEQH